MEKSYRELSQLLGSIEDFLNTPANKILQIKLGYLTEEQLEKARERVRNNPKILDEYKDKEVNCCDCLKAVLCIEILYGHTDYSAECNQMIPPKYRDKYPLEGYCYCPMFIPRFFEGIKGLKNIPQKLPEGWWE